MNDQEQANTAVDRVSELEAQDKAGLLHPFTVLKDFANDDAVAPQIIDSGSGVYIRDARGRMLLDAFAGLYCVNIGYGRQEMAEAISAQVEQLAYYHSYAGSSNEPAIRLSNKILEMAPPNMRKVFFGLSGSDANETQVKLVWYYHNVIGKPQKKKIISRHRGYHGSTIVSGSLTGLPFYHGGFDIPAGPIRHTTAPHHFWNAEPGMTEEEFSRKCANDLEDLILAEGPDTIGAFIAEPALGTGGLVPPPRGYWDVIQRVLKRYDILLIADEVVTAFGRLGSRFGSEHYNIEPDLITVAKGLTSAYLPLSASIVGERVWEVLQRGSEVMGAFPHGYTYTAHPACAAAGLRNLEIVERERLHVNAAETGAYLQKRLRDTFSSHPLVAEVRGEGLMAAVEFLANPEQRERFDASLKVGPRLSAACLAEGVITRAMPHGDILGFAPPLVITRGEVDQLVEGVERGVNKAVDSLVREGAIKLPS